MKALVNRGSYYVVAPRKQPAIYRSNAISRLNLLKSKISLFDRIHVYMYSICIHTVYTPVFFYISIIALYFLIYPRYRARYGLLSIEKRVMLNGVDSGHDYVSGALSALTVALSDLNDNKNNNTTMNRALTFPLQVRVLADPTARYTNEIRMGVERPDLGGVRSRRYSMITDDGVVRELYVEGVDAEHACLRSAASSSWDAADRDSSERGAKALGYSRTFKKRAKFKVIWRASRTTRLLDMFDRTMIMGCRCRGLHGAKVILSCIPLTRGWDTSIPIIFRARQKNNQGHSRTFKNFSRPCRIQGHLQGIKNSLEPLDTSIELW